MKTSYLHVPPKNFGQTFDDYNLRNKKDIRITKKLTIQLYKTIANLSVRLISEYSV